MMKISSVIRSVLVACVLGFTASPASAAIVHRWNFNEGSGTNLLDSVGTAHGNIVIANVQDYNRSSSNVILTGGAWTTTDYIQNTFLRFALTTAGGGGEQQVNSPATLPINVMKHIVVTINGSVGILYQDGVPIGTNNAMTLNPTSMGSTTLNFLGKSQYADPYFSGTMDEFRIYDTALPASIIASNFADGPDALATAPPTTVNDFATLNPGAKVLVPVLANDTGPAPVPATVSVFNPPANGTARVSYDKVPNLGVLVETTDALGQPWQLWNVPGNALWFPATGGEQTLFGPVTTNKFFRARLVEP